MAKTKTAQLKGLAFQDATEQDKAAARSVIADHKKHRYYVGRIYKLFNKVTGKNDVAQNCASCLRTRAKAIEAWYNEGAKAAAPAIKANAKKTGGVKVTNDPKPVTLPAGGAPVAVEPDSEHPTATTDPNGNPAPAVGVMRLPLNDGTFIDFTPNDGADFADGVKGIATTLEGKKAKAGTYETAQGHLVKVAVGGKATYAEVEDLT